VRELTDEQWEYVSPYLPSPQVEPARGRPPHPDRLVLEAILWKLRTQAAWHDLPARYPPSSTCYDRFRLWRDTGVLQRVFQALAVHLAEQLRLDATTLLELLQTTLRSAPIHPWHERTLHFLLAQHLSGELPDDMRLVCPFPGSADFPEADPPRP
jgi:transposase